MADFFETRNGVDVSEKRLPVRRQEKQIRALVRVFDGDDVYCFSRMNYKTFVFSL